MAHGLGTYELMEEEVVGGGAQGCGFHAAVIREGAAVLCDVGKAQRLLDAYAQSLGVQQRKGGSRAAPNEDAAIVGGEDGGDDERHASEA